MGAGDGESFVADFLRWAAAERVAAAADSRARQSSLSAQAAASSTWAGILVDLAEAGAVHHVAVGGERLLGRVVGVGKDFFVLERAGGRGAVVASGHVSSLTAAPGGDRSAAAPSGDRPPPLGYGLASVMAMLAEERSPVVVHTRHEALNGVLVAVGEDVLTLQDGTRAGPQRRPIHIPLAAVAWCEPR